MRASTDKLIFNDERRTVLLRVDGPGIQEESIREVASREGLSEKADFHITIIGFETGLKIGQGDFERIKGLAKGLDWNFAPTNEIFLVSKEYPEGETRQSILQKVTLPSLKPLYSAMAADLKIVADVPFPHITLFAGSSVNENRLRGIGVYSEAQFRALSPLRISH